MKIIVLILLVFTSLAWAEDEWESDYPMIAGQYEVIGKQCESGKLFTGSINIKEVRPNDFTVTRIIDGPTTIGSGQVELTLFDKIPVFRIHFVENGRDMKGTFQWHTDLDNFGRITGYVYPKGYKGRNPGLEALFAKKGIVERDGADQPATRPELHSEGEQNPH